MVCDAQRINCVIIQRQRILTDAQPWIAHDIAQNFRAITLIYNGYPELSVGYAF
jgi:hypothetical protein